MKISSLLPGPAPKTQLERNVRRLSVYTVALIYARTAAAKKDLQARIQVVNNQIRLAELVSKKKEAVL
jgi:hypothetical protein